MTRSPLFYPLKRGMDYEAGGAAELQTDVMRFMAILALCLVAIFALVQSIPLAPPVSAPPAPPPETPAVAPARVSAPVAPVPADPAQERPSPEPASEPAKLPRTAAEAPASASVPEAPVPDPVPEVAHDTAPPESLREPATTGFTLSFESDLALTRLVARNEVALYALTEAKSLRMSVNRGRISFWPAATPNQVHEMTSATVPATVVQAQRRAGAFGPNETVRWGVTLTPKIRRQLQGYLDAEKGGALVIDVAGNLRLEP